MNYNKAALRAQAVAVKDLHVKQIVAAKEREKAQYEKDLERWRTKEKQATIDALKVVVDKVRKDQPFSYRELHTLLGAPKKPKDEVECCTPMTSTLDGFIALLDSINDEQVTSNALSMAGFKDLSRLLRKPC